MGFGIAVDQEDSDESTDINMQAASMCGAKVREAPVCPSYAEPCI